MATVGFKFISGDVIYCPRSGRKERITCRDYESGVYRCESGNKIRFSDEDLWEFFVREDAFYVAIDDFGDVYTGQILKYKGEELIDRNYTYYAVTPEEIEQHFDRWDVRKHGKKNMYVSYVENGKTLSVYIIGCIENGKIMPGKIMLSVAYNISEDKIYRNEMFYIADFENIVPASKKDIALLQEKLKKVEPPVEIFVGFTDELEKTLIEFDNKMTFFEGREELRKLKPHISRLTRNINRTLEVIKRNKNI